MTADFLRPGQSALPAPARIWPAPGRRVVIAAVVVVLHLGLLWALQNGLVMRAAEVLVPVEILAQIIEPPAPRVATAPPEPPEPLQMPKPVEKPPPATEKKVPPRPQPRTEPQPRPLTQAEPTPNAPVVIQAPAVEAAKPAPPSPPPVPSPAPPAPAAVQLPSSDADYLQNPKPPYPPMSKRLGEQGKTTVRVLIGADGRPQRAEVAQSSGFDRLDQAALATALRWQYVPGKRGGVAETMWFSIPINWVLE